MKKHLLGLIIILGSFAPSHAMELWVSPSGNDAGDGTRDQPFKSVSMALRQVRESRRTKKVGASETVVVKLTGGTHRLSSPLLVRPEDSGSAASPTVIAAADGERPVLSGGVPVTGWRKVTEEIAGLPATSRGTIWWADAPRSGGRTLEFRQMWVNGEKAVRARTPNSMSMDRLQGWDTKAEEAWIPAASLANLRNPGNAEMVIHQQWAIAVCRIKSFDIEAKGARIRFHEPEGRIEFEHPWPQPVISPNGNSPFFLTNAIEFLDEPGEWFQELQSGRIYYKPRPGEEMERAEVIVPALETLVRITGSLDRPVQHVHFNGVGFQHTTWLRPSHEGHVPLQAGMFLIDSYKLEPKGTPDWRSLENQAWIGRPPAAVTANAAQDLRFERCRFERLASAGFDCDNGTTDSVIEGCVFRDVGGNGIQAGKFSDIGIETHLPYNPADKREICRRLRIANNLLTDTANEDWGCVALCVGYGTQITIEHNDISDTSYTGINLGWGWTRTSNCMSGNFVHANHIHRPATRMCDTAGIYTLSCQPGTVISENSIHDIRLSPFAFDPEHWAYLYLDEGSSHITVRDNWTPEEKYLSNAVGPDNVWTNNGPSVPDAIRSAAGLQQPFRDLLSEPGPELKATDPAD